MQQEFIKEATFKITPKQLEKIRPYLENIDELLQDYELFQEELDDAIVYYLDSNNGYEHTPTSIMLEEIYDEIYYQN